MPMPGFIAESGLIEAALATLAAVTGAPDALKRGDAMAKRLLNEGNWNLITWASYHAKTPEQRLAFWASGEIINQLNYTQSLKQQIKNIYETWIGSAILPGSSAYQWFKIWDEGGLPSLPAALTDPLAGIVKLVGFIGGAWLVIQLVAAWRGGRNA